MKSKYKRTRSHWEPIFSPATNFEQFKEFDWNFQNVNAVKNLYCNADILKSKIIENPRFKIQKFSFESCDFAGEFNFSKITFSECKFHNCDMGDNVWLNIKFSKCEFINFSFSTVKFHSSQFIECSWLNIGISSNEMHFVNCLLTNPCEFINSAYTNIDKEILKQEKTNPEYQLYRLEGTKAKAARMILSNLQMVGDDDAFYEAVKCYTTQVIFAKISARKQQIKSSTQWHKIIFHFLIKIGLILELFILSLSGRINGWGASVGRSASFGILLALIFTLIYYSLGMVCITRRQSE